MAPDPDSARVCEHEADPMRAVFDALPVPTAITRRSDGRILFANPACLELLGWEETQFVGRTMEEVGFWAGPERRAQMLEHLRANGEVRELEEEITTRSGERRVVLTSISAVVLHGEPCLVGHVYDVTERRRLEVELRQSEARFRQVTENSHQGFMLRDLDPPAVLYASPAIERIFGVERSVFAREPNILTTLVHPDDRARVVQQHDAMTGATDFEFRIVRPDGETRWIRTRAEPVRMEDGHVARIAAVSEDVTEERVLQDALRESEERFRLLAENSTDVIARSSLEGQILYISPACRTLYGYEPEEMVGRPGLEFVHPDHRAALLDELPARLADHGDATHEYRVRRRDGSYVWAEAKTRTVRDPVTGDATELHTSVRDITERKQADLALGRAKDEAERANGAKSEFLSRMSHELRTPLHAILGFGELLGRDVRNDQRDALGQITRAGRHLVRLINEVLDLSRIERGELSPSLEPVHVGQVVAETLDMIAPLAAAGSVSIPPPGAADLDVHVLADRQLLKQVLLNLLSNAVKYNREGGWVTVSATVDPPRVRIEVTDTGIGIATADRARVFAPFDRLGADATEVEGTGLGLALAERLVDAMGGEIGLVSELGAGTTLWLELTLAAEPEAPSASAGGASSVRDTHVREAAKTVLYIEDNPSNIKLVETILARRPDVSLLVATHGSLGLELAREHRPSLVLLDLNLPDASGEDVLRRLRDDPRTADAAVVIVSADATPGQVARLLAAGADDYLTKPFEIEQLLAIIDGWSPAATDGDERAAPGGVLDLGALQKLRDLSADKRAVREFVDLFVEDSSSRMQALAAAARAGEAEAVWQAAHAWRGACVVTGARKVDRLLTEIQTAAADGEAPSEDCIATLEAAHRETVAALEHELA